MPIRRLDQESSIVYQHGFHVGLKGQYAGVSTRRMRIIPPIAADFILFFMSKAGVLIVSFLSMLFADQGGEIFYA